MAETPQIASTDDATDNGRTVLVELFTSEGCSSCPPADRVLADLVGDEAIDVAAIAFHVDYWNYLGWSDRFSSERWSERQRKYADAFSTSRIYTPQLLFDGRDLHVGAQRQRVRQAIDHSRRDAPARTLELTAQRMPRSVAVSVDIGKATSANPATQSLMVALVVDALSTDVKRGENAGRTLEHVAVALDLAEACEWTDTGARTCEAKFRLEPGETRDLGVVAFVQDDVSMRVGQSVRVAL